LHPLSIVSRDEQKDDLYKGGKYDVAVDGSNDSPVRPFTCVCISNIKSSHSLKLAILMATIYVLVWALLLVEMALCLLLIMPLPRTCKNLPYFTLIGVSIDVVLQCVLFSLVSSPNPGS
jgi:hypothetical protein